MINHELYNDGSRRWVFFGRETGLSKNLIDTNQYLIAHNGEGMLLDPGGIETFPSVVSTLAKEISLENVTTIFASHQDPDIISSLSLWLGLIPSVVVYVPWVWGTFIPHFGGGKRVNTIPDEGMTLGLGGSNNLTLVPAHYVHSSGNYSLYDPVAKILFSGDIGAALLPDDYNSIFVDDFNKHIQYMIAFHRRWMPSNRAKNKWVQRVRELDVKMLCPQHGAIFRDGDVKRFLDWFEELDVGTAF